MLVAAGCALQEPSAPPSELEPESQTTAPQLQALVMDLADEYVAALGEAVYLSAPDGDADPRSRALASSFLRNGTGAAIDIGASSNPSVALLDLLVLSALQTWAIGQHWIPAGIDPERGRRAHWRRSRAHPFQ